MAPAGARSRVAANLQALRILAEIEREERSATVAERELLARWSSWGAVPTVFAEDREEWLGEREELRVLLGDERHWAQARRTTINAHYTHPEIATAMWDLGYSQDTPETGNSGSAHCWYRNRSKPGQTSRGRRTETRLFRCSTQATANLATRTSLDHGRERRGP